MTNRNTSPDFDAQARELVISWEGMIGQAEGDFPQVAEGDISAALREAHAEGHAEGRQERYSALEHGLACANAQTEDERKQVGPVVEALEECIAALESIWSTTGPVRVDRIDNEGRKAIANGRRALDEYGGHDG
jgi:hypothetical protein